MAANQLFEGCLFSSCQETLEQLAVRGRILIRKGSDLAQVVQQCVHRKPFLVEKGSSIYSPKGVRRVHYFWVFPEKIMKRDQVGFPLNGPSSQKRLFPIRGKQVVPSLFFLIRFIRHALTEVRIDKLSLDTTAFMSPALRVSILAPLLLATSSVTVSADDNQNEKGSGWVSI
jgi:hypothetical protein